MSKCESCNKSKPDCSCSKGFTPAVVKIENPEELILFHKVIIPVSMGDEKDTPVTIGKYCNVLMVYEANGHAYLYSSDGIPSKISFDSGGVLYVEELPEVEQASVGFLYIDKTGRASITNDNQSWVTISGGGGGISDFNLLTNRPKVDGVEMTNETDIPLSQIQTDLMYLDADITNEEAERKAGDQANASAIAAETQARTQADNSLSSRIDSLSSSLSAEAADRAQADAALQQAINDEKTARQNADTTLRNDLTDAINTLDAEITNDMALIQQQINDEAQARATADAGKVDKVAGKGLSTNDFTNADKDKLDSAIQPDNIDYTVMTDLSMSSTPSTTSVVMEGNKVNLKEGTPSDFELPLPVASATQAGVINTATYQSIQSNTAKINAIENGAVAITGISATPAQSDLTTAWQTATGLTTLINGASILDVDNDLRWTYYTNSSTWYSASTSGSITINPFTNTEAGTIKGSNVDGQVHAETDGTGSVQGWDTVKADIADNASLIATKVDAETGKGLSQNDFTDALKAKLEGIETGAEVNDPLYSTTGSNTDGAMTQAATTNALDTKVDKVTGKGLSTNDFTDTLKTKLDGIEDGAQANRPIYTATGQNTDGSMTQKAITDALDAKLDNLSAGAGIDATQLESDVVAIADNGITTPKIANQAVTSGKIDWSTLSINSFIDVLYQNTGGIVTNITLSNNINNYRLIGIQYLYNGDSGSRSTAYLSPSDGATFGLTTTRTTGSATYVAHCRITMSGTNITIDNGSRFAIEFTGGVNGANGNQIKIEAVLGIR